MKKIATVEYKGQLRTLNTHLASGANYITDAPTDNHGRGEAFSPTDLLATSLADCILTIIGIEASKKDIQIGAATADVSKLMKATPRRVAKVQIDISITSSASDAEERFLEEKGRNCPVALSLHPDLIQEVSFIWQKN